MSAAEYVCIRPCHHGKPTNEYGVRPARKLYQPGDKEWFDPESEMVPKHFIPLIEYAPPGPPKEGIATPPVIRGLRAPVDPDKLRGLNKARSPKAKDHAQKGEK
jgi:hypothetical protein